MASEQLPSNPQVRKPRIGMLVNGTQVPPGALLQFSVENTNTFSTDTWRAEIALNGMSQGYGAPYWALEPQVEVQLLASVAPGASLTEVMGGYVDEVQVDWDNQTMVISGRDYTAALVDNLSNDQLTNQTSSQVAELLAKRRGLTPKVTATTSQVGRYLNEQTNYMAEDISEWRVLSFLAQQEGFDLYGQGKNLVFAPAVADTSPLIVQYFYASPQSPNIRANVPKLITTHKKVLAGKVGVQVRSWDHRNKQATISTFYSQKNYAYPSKSGKPSVPATKLTRGQSQSGYYNSPNDGPLYIVRRSGLTQAQADDLAQKTLKDVTSHERTVEFSCPGILGIDARRSIRLTGTGTAWDMDYPIKSISRTFNWDGGFSMTVQAKSGSPDEAVRL